MLFQGKIFLPLYLSINLPLLGTFEACLGKNDMTLNDSYDIAENVS